MACDFIQLPDGSRAIVCSNRKRQRCDACGAAATLLCDWKVPEHRSGTCDRPICRSCATSPAPEKDLCPQHAQAFSAWQARRAEGNTANGQ